MSELGKETGGRIEGVEVTFENDTRAFRKTGSNSRAVYLWGYIKKGLRILVGGENETTRFDYDHRTQKFVPWLDNPHAKEGDETSVGYVRTEDLGDGWEINQ